MPYSTIEFPGVVPIHTCAWTRAFVPSRAYAQYSKDIQNSSGKTADKGEPAGAKK